jgi:multiple sugar transport system permease protein
VTEAPVETPEKPKPALSEGKKAERRLGLWLCAPAAIVMIAVTGYPILYSIWLSLQR